MANDNENLHDDDDLLDFDEDGLDLGDDEDLDEAHDAMNAEKKSNDSVDKAAKTGPRGKKRHADKSNAENGGKAYKADKGIVRELFDMMSEMNSEELAALKKIMSEGNLEEVSGESEEDVLENAEYDFEENVAALVESEATLSEGFKEKAGTIMEAAVKSRLRVEIARLEESYEEQLSEEIAAEKEDLVDKVDSFLNHVVTEWMEENKLQVESGLRTEIAENFMTSLKDLFVESYIEVPEEKVDLVDDLSEQVDRLESELNSRMDKFISVSEELNEYKRESVLIDEGKGLVDTQFDKLVDLCEDIDFVDENTFRSKVSNIKETYFNGKKKPTGGIMENNYDDIDENNDDDTIIPEDMSAYIHALRSGK